MRSKSKLIYRCCGYLSENVWGRFPKIFHIGVSKFLSSIYKMRFSRFFIAPYCHIQYGDSRYYTKFKPEYGGTDYRTFQDFFTRCFLDEPTIHHASVWPCEGLLCDYGLFRDLSLIKVKNEPIPIRKVFGESGDSIPDNYHFTNIFLHNNNYHHIHAPTAGTITKIEYIPGHLLWLRPWFYKDKPSIPALTNERINVDILDTQQRTWFISIVGGPLVATIRLAKGMEMGAALVTGQKIATFEIGSTCCMASPEAPTAKLDDKVEVCKPYHCANSLSNCLCNSQVKAT